MLALWKENHDKPRQSNKKQRHHFADKVHIVKAMFFPVVMYGYESWTIKKAVHRRIDAFKVWCWSKLLRVPLDCKEIKPVNPKGNKPWLFIGRTDAEAEASILWAPDEKSWHTGKDSDVGTNWRQRRRDRQTMRWLDTITESMDMNLNNFQETVGYRSVCCCYCC